MQYSKPPALSLIWSTTSLPKKELSKRLNITKVTLHKYRKEGKIPFSQVGRTIRYDYKEVMETLKFKK